MTPIRLIAVAFVLALVGAGAWALGVWDRASSRLGPVDGHDLPAEDLDRIQVGDEAPDFALEAYGGGVRRLSDYRGEKNVVLVFYRGHW